MKRKNRLSLAFVLLVALSALSFKARAWNANFDTDSNKTVRPTKAHNWIVYRAIEELEAAGLLKDMHEKIDSDRYTPYQLISFGLWYADHVWGAVPENKDAMLTGVFEQDDTQSNLKGVVVAKDRASDGPDNYETSLVYDQVHENGENKNLYLRVKWWSDQNMPGDDGFNIKKGADNPYHFANHRNNEMRGMPLNSMDEKVFGKTDFGAAEYGAELYILAQKFFQANIIKHPYLNELAYMHAMDTGTTYLDVYGDNDQGFLTAKYPSFYVGGNPFICGNVNPVQASEDACKYANATWPLWVPDKSITGFVQTNAETKQKFRAALLANDPGKQYRAALIYLGWALHMLGDLSMPEHAVDRTHRYHEKHEDRMDRDFIQDPTDWINWNYSEMWDTIDQLKGDMNRTCENIGAGLRNQYRYANLTDYFDSMQQYSDDYGNDFLYESSSEAYREPIKMAAAKTATLLACFFNVTDAAYISVLQ